MMRKTKLNIGKLTSKQTVVDPIKAFKQTQMKLLTKEPFVATVMLNLHHRYDDTGEQCPTAMTDGITITYNQEWFLGLTPAERIFLLAHEVWHVILQHTDPDRLGNRDRKIWNHAGDYVINYILKDQNVGEMPENGLYNKDFKEKSTEEVYDLIKDESEETQAIIGAMNPMGNDVKPTLMSAEDKMTITQAIVQAASAVSGQEAEKLPGFVKEMIDKILHPQHDWKAQLRDFVSAKTKNDYAWSRPNRRTDPDLYMPSLYSETPESIVIAIDTSGSIQPKDLEAFLGEIKSIHEDVRPLNTHIIQVDTQVHAPMHFGEWDRIPTTLEAEGRGGTNFQPAFDWAEDHNPSCLIYLTDLYARDPVPPSYPTLWVSTTAKKEGPFGRTIHLKI
jgi:predicted metal-dependent peptidase